MPLDYTWRVELVLKLIETNDYYWHILVAINGLAIGWLLTIKTNLSFQQKIVGTISYLLVVGINFTDLLDSYRLLNSAHEGLKILECPEQNLKSFCDVLNNRDYSFRSRWLNTSLIHVVAVFLVLLMIWNDKFWGKFRGSAETSKSGR